MSDGIHDPIVIDPPGLDLKAAWAECNEASKHVVGEDGEVNWRAAFSADPGCCTCPACHAYHWAWGRRQRCTECGFEYPTDWWSMYAWGNGAARNPRAAYAHQKRMEHPYYRYGFEHPVEDAWAEHDRIDWKAALGGADATPERTP